MRKDILQTYWQLPFADQSHENFYTEWVHDLGRTDAASIVTIYLLGATAPTRTAFADLVDCRDVYISDDCWSAPWQTADSRRVIALAANLTVGGDYDHIDPAHLFDCSPELVTVMLAAIRYWSSHQEEAA